MASQVEDAQALGVEAYGWLPTTPRGCGDGRLRPGAGADTIVLSRQLETPRSGSGSSSSRPATPGESARPRAGALHGT